MKKVSKYIVALCVVALFGAMMVGCGGQAASSSSKPPEPVKLTADELVAELDPIVKDASYKSVTLDMTGNIKMDFAEMLGMNDTEASGEAATAEAASGEAATAEAASGEAASAEAASAEAATAEAASGEAASTEASDSVMDIPIDTHAECDISSGAVKMHLKMNMAGMEYELYIDGQDAVMVMGGKAAKTTLAELNMEQYGSVESIMKSQAGNVDLNALKSAVKSAEKVVEGDETVYNIVLDGKAFVESNEQLQALQMMGESLDDVNVTYRVSADKKLTGADISMAGKGYSSDINCKLSNYDSTVVPEAPQATMTLEELQEAIGADLVNEAGQAIEQEVATADQTAKAA